MGKILYEISDKAKIYVKKSLYKETNDFALLDLYLCDPYDEFCVILIEIPDISFSINALNNKHIWFHRLKKSNWGMRVAYGNTAPDTREFYLNSNKPYKISIDKDDNISSGKPTVIKISIKELN